jgi:hypothetical protein
VGPQVHAEKSAIADPRPAGGCAASPRRGARAPARADAARRSVGDDGRFARAFVEHGGVVPERPTPGESPRVQREPRGSRVRVTSSDHRTVRRREALHAATTDVRLGRAQRDPVGGDLGATRVGRHEVVPDTAGAPAAARGTGSRTGVQHFHFHLPATGRVHSRRRPCVKWKVLTPVPPVPPERSGAALRCYVSFASIIISLSTSGGFAMCASNPTSRARCRSSGCA